jgi:hypothetical protein
MNFITMAFIVILLKAAFASSNLDDVKLTTATHHVHRSEIDEENDADDYEINHNKHKKQNKEIIISNVKGLFACMLSYKSISECDEVEWFK